MRTFYPSHLAKAAVALLTTRAGCAYMQLLLMSSTNAVNAARYDGDWRLRVPVDRPRVGAAPGHPTIADGSACVGVARAMMLASVAEPLRSATETRWGCLPSSMAASWCGSIRIDNPSA